MEQQVEEMEAVALEVKTFVVEWTEALYIFVIHKAV